MKKYLLSSLFAVLFFCGFTQTGQYGVINYPVAFPKGAALMLVNGLPATSPFYNKDAWVYCDTSHSSSNGFLYCWNIVKHKYDTISTGTGGGLVSLTGRDTIKQGITYSVFPNGNSLAVYGTYNYGEYPRLYTRPGTLAGSVRPYFDSLYRFSYVNGAGLNRTFWAPYAGDVMIRYPYLSSSILADSGQVAAQLALKQSLFSGNQYYYPYYTGVSSLATNSLLGTNGTGIGIGTITPRTNLEIYGSPAKNSGLGQVVLSNSTYGIDQGGSVGVWINADGTNQRQFGEFGIRKETSGASQSGYYYVSLNGSEWMRMGSGGSVSLKGNDGSNGLLNLNGTLVNNYFNNVSNWYVQRITPTINYNFVGDNITGLLIQPNITGNNTFVKTVTISNGGSGYTDGYYSNQGMFKYVSGSLNGNYNAQFAITVSGGTVTSVSYIPGTSSSGFFVGDSLGIVSGLGSGTGFKLKITSVMASYGNSIGLDCYQDLVARNNVRMPGLPLSTNSTDSVLVKTAGSDTIKLAPIGRFLGGGTNYFSKTNGQVSLATATDTLITNRFQYKIDGNSTPNFRFDNLNGDAYFGNNEVISRQYLRQYSTYGTAPTNYTALMGSAGGLAITSGSNTGIFRVSNFSTVRTIDFQDKSYTTADNADIIASGSYNNSTKNITLTRNSGTNPVTIDLSTISGGSTSSAEYFDIINSNSDYTASSGNGTVQNIIVGGITTNVNFNLFTPSSNTVIYISNPSARNLITNVSFYYNDSNSDTVISSNSVIKLIYSISKSKWYAINIQ